MFQLLGWMHRKIRQNSTGTTTDFKTGNSCICPSIHPSFCEHQHYHNQTLSSANSGHCSWGSQKYSSELKGKRVEEVHGEEMINAPFDGFLTIGTLGSEPTITEPSTPILSKPFNKTTDKETQVTVNELKLINYELEKFLEAETKELGNESSERSSHVSIVTICEKQKGDVANEEIRDLEVCPLQGYLFGSSIELPDSNIEIKKERTSLGQLFKRTSMANEYSTNMGEKPENQGKGTSDVSFVKKMLKKLYSSPRESATSAAGSKAAAPVSTKHKLPKVLRMFHKKIHPERPTGKEELNRSHKLETKKATITHGYSKQGVTLQDRHNNRPSFRTVLKKEITNLHPIHKQISSGGLTQKKEHWIKTDANCKCLVLILVPH
ncbi:hypothetical protein NMG60_11006860 [Bertholletia excelsa]